MKYFKTLFYFKNCDTPTSPFELFVVEILRKCNTTSSIITQRQKLHNEKNRKMAAPEARASHLSTLKKNCTWNRLWLPNHVGRLAFLNKESLKICIRTRTSIVL